jgi:hypothetical protein
MSKDKKDSLKAPGDANLAKVDFGEYAGAGMENVGQNDVQIPFLTLLQQLSPQLSEGDPKFIEGAKVGQLINSVTNELIGDEAYFVPCCKDSVYVEWIPRDAGGGLVAIHELNSELVRACKAAAEDQFKLKTDEGHDLVETHYVYGLLIDGPEGNTMLTPMVVGFSSTKIKIYRSQLMTRIRTMKGDPPMFAFRFKITSVPDKNKQGQPYRNFKIDPACGDMKSSLNLPGTDFENLLKEGMALVKAVRGGVAKAAVDSQDDTAQSDGDEPF